jgi:flavin reductase (DIM6/NTAB) family NADH-FMN oxidoreductase RutF
MYLDVATTPVLEVYQALVGIVTPRPIAWITTIDKEGRVNLAPFSFFNTFGSNPPVVVFSTSNKRDLSKKDTLLNLEEVPEFVINSSVLPLAEAVNRSAKELPRFESEAEMLGLELLPATKVRPPRVKGTPAHMEGKVLQVISIGDGPMSGNLVIGEILAFHIDDAILDNTGKVDPQKIQTIGRMGGNWYCKTSELFEMPRP